MDDVSRRVDRFCALSSLIVDVAACRWRADNRPVRRVLVLTNIENPATSVRCRRRAPGRGGSAP